METVNPNIILNKSHFVFIISILTIIYLWVLRANNNTQYKNNDLCVLLHNYIFTFIVKLVTLVILVTHYSVTFSFKLRVVFLIIDTVPKCILGYV